MGQSGMRGRVYVIDDGCPVYDPDTGVWTPPGGTAVIWFDEVTRFVCTESVNKREYGHDKSAGAQDVVAGTWRCEVTLDAMFIPSTPTVLYYAGKVLFLELYPLGATGTCNTPIRGYALIDRISWTYDQERGDPIGYSCTMSSKGPWSGIGPGLESNLFGGFECLCGA